MTWSRLKCWSQYLLVSAVVLMSTAQSRADEQSFDEFRLEALSEFMSATAISALRFDEAGFSDIYNMHAGLQILTADIHELFREKSGISCNKNPNLTLTVSFPLRPIEQSVDVYRVDPALRVSEPTPDCFNSFLQISTLSHSQYNEQFTVSDSVFRRPVHSGLSGGVFERRKRYRFSYYRPFSSFDQIKQVWVAEVVKPKSLIARIYWSFRGFSGDASGDEYLYRHLFHFDFRFGVGEWQ